MLSIMSLLNFIFELFIKASYTNCPKIFNVYFIAKIKNIFLLNKKE